MISHLSGKIIHKEESYLVLDISGVGYKVFATGNTLTALSSTAELWIHTAIRENSHDLYGFLSKEELDFFELLISISGIGPKTALAIMNVVNIDTLKQAVASENSAHLIKVSGIGRKTAEKIVLELRDKLKNEYKEGFALKEEGDAIEALSAIGYTQKEARDALREVPDSISGTSNRVKHALKLLSSK